MKIDIFSSSQLRAFIVSSSHRYKEAFAYTLWAFSGLLITGLTTELSLSQISKLSGVLIPTWFLITLAIYILNDLSDRKFDKLVGNDQPIATGEVKPKNALPIVFVFSITALLLSSLVNPFVLLISATYLGIGVIYSTPPLHIKKRLMGKQFTLTSLFLLSLLAGGASVLRFPPTLLFLIMVFGIFTFFMTPIPDLKDMKSDSKQGCKSLPLLIGPKYCIYMGILAFSTLLFFAIWGFLYFNFNFFLIPMTALLSLANICFVE
ncbi:hypothetical protein AKJ63_02215 [candidate division MSBL1 archaeon SCGC-AAA259D18]|uniref:Prenyltransferase n=1 Tax=candidate division MSBL1 archaeon SCGC-AAA259D18 TaxID=1698262 RepID=A0A133U996_9EURY|nr:hypothetical protein AKJ63_02215 [candidate division MSBL1 archaeon SCGC-AAA259D18]